MSTPEADEVAGDVRGTTAVGNAWHIPNRLTVAGKSLRSFSHQYWTDADATERTCLTPANTVKCRCGLFTLIWARG